MNKVWNIGSLLGIGAALIALPALAQKAPNDKNQPIEISSDKLDVYQDDHKAIFTGNVIAIQGTMNMRSKQMTVFYRQDDSKTKAKPGAPGAASAPAPKPAKADDATSAQGISRIEAEGNVIFTTPTETAQGDLGIYNADTDMIDLTGKVVTLTQDKNVLKGTALNYNMDTGRSILTAGGAKQDVSGTVNAANAKPARVHGLFIPQSDKSNAATPAVAPKAGQ